MKKFTFYLDEESKTALELLSSNDQFRFNQSMVLRHLIGTALSEQKNNVCLTLKSNEME